MLAEAIERIRALGEEAAGFFELPQTDPRIHRVLINGAVESFEVAPEFREHDVDTLEDLIAWAESGMCDNPVVWHGRSRVVLLLDDTDREDRVQFSLDYSEPFKAIIALAEKRPKMEQRAVIQLLRVDLGLQDPELIGRFRALDWSDDRQTRGQVHHGKESLGREINAELMGANGLPEEITAEVPLYRNQGERAQYPITLIVDVDPVNQRIALVPRPNQLDEVLATHQAWIRQRLLTALEDGTDVRIYAGSP